MTVAIISHSDCLLHEMGVGHPEQPNRIKAIDAALRQAEFKDQLVFWEAPLAMREQLSLVHPVDYVDQIIASSPAEGLFPLDPDTSMNPHSLQAALRSAGAGIMAVDAVMQGKVQAAFCNVRPPGHHAEYAKAMGFCFFNNVAVAARHALAQYGLQRVAIIDFDVHHGNGTEDIFRNDSRVLLCSSFQHPFYPFSGTENVSSHIINSPLPIGASSTEFFPLVLDQWLPAVRAFKPEMIFFSAGFDAHEEDILANLRFKTEDYFWVTSQFKSLADEVCEGRVVSMLEGGYSLGVLGAAAVAHVRGLLGFKHNC